MKKLYRACVIFLLTLIVVPFGDLKAGNDDRRGTSGAGILLINPWVRSSGWGGMNTACGIGIDALHTNPAGLGRTENTAVQLSYSNWMRKTDIGVSSLGLAQPIGEFGVLGLTVTSMGFGRNQLTHELGPDIGQNATFSINLMNVGLSFAHAFSTSIYGGATLKIISESIDNLSASGFSLDAGVQYVTGDNYEIKFGIALKNWGTSMSYSGDGLSTLGSSEHSGSHSLSLQQRSALFELPSCLNIGASYDILFGNNDMHRITIAGNFTSHAFSRDQYGIGLEYGLMKYLMVRGGFVYEEDLFKDVKDFTAGAASIYSGPTAGVSIFSPIGKKKEGSSRMNLSVDYAYRMTRVLGGIHTVGLSFEL